MSRSRENHELQIGQIDTLLRIILVLKLLAKLQTTVAILLPLSAVASIHDGMDEKDHVLLKVQLSGTLFFLIRN